MARSINNGTLIENRSHALAAGREDGEANERREACRPQTSNVELGSIPRPVAMETAHGNERRNRVRPTASDVRH